jgi:hypothetical protein
MQNAGLAPANQGVGQRRDQTFARLLFQTRAAAHKRSLDLTVHGANTMRTVKRLLGIICSPSNHHLRVIRVLPA